MDGAGDFEALVATQRRELTEASAAESDLDLAFRLQMKEAMAASLAFQSPASSAASSSSAPTASAVASPPLPDPDGEGVSEIIAAQAMEFERFHQERRDSEQCQAEYRRATEDLLRRAHDDAFARDVLDMPEEEWEDYGDEFERPMGTFGVPFRLYFKGLTCIEQGRDGQVQVSAIGVAVCDQRNNLVLKVQKPLLRVETCREALEATALIEGLNAVISLGIKSVDVFCDHKALYNHVTGKWAVKQRKIVNLLGQVSLLKRKLESCEMFLLPRCHVKFVFKLARDVIDSQLMKNGNLNGSKDKRETCNICLEVTDSSQMFTVDGCSHCYCFSCMKQHVEVKLLNGVLPGCPHDGCKIMLNIESSRKYLSPRLLEIMILRIKEASIPANEKVYCPYPKCSALMSGSEVIHPQQESSSKQVLTDTSGHRKCIKCFGSFCIKCKVPWHGRLSCYDYKRLNPQPREDSKLQTLAKQNLWRQCVKCKHMIELVEGCFHMTCRCGFEFCYTCGAEWMNKKATCSCPLWAEHQIWHNNNEDVDSDEDDFNNHDDEDEYYYGPVY